MSEPEPASRGGARHSRAAGRQAASPEPGTREPGTRAAGTITRDAGEPDDGAERPGEHPTAGIDDTVHQRHRLGILTITAEAQRADFGQLRAALGLTAGNLSRHLTVLEEAELIQVEKGYEGRRARTWVRITGQGRQALAAELAALTELVRRHSAAGRPPAG